MPPKPKFADGEKVLCVYGPLLYEAKISKICITKDKEVKYFVHYAGWNKNWDDWVDENRVLEFNDTNVQRQKDLTILHKSTTMNDMTMAEQSTPNLNISSTSRSQTLSPDSATSITSTPNRQQNTSRKSKQRSKCNNRNKGSKNKKRLNDPSKEVKIGIPEELKPWLVDDWDAINRQHKLLEIPAKETAKDIIDLYVQMKKSNESMDQVEEAVLNDVMYGLVAYFNDMLDSQLLYKSERPQYTDIIKEHSDTPMANLYGSFHLLRLFVRLGSVLADTGLGEKEINIFMQHVQDFLKYLVENIGIYFSMQHFVSVTPDAQYNSQPLDID